MEQETGDSPGGEWRGITLEGGQDENAQRRMMSEEDRLTLDKYRCSMDPDDLDYTGAHTANFYRKRCEKLGFGFPDEYYDAFALYDHGIHAKQYRSLLKKQSKKMRIAMKSTKISFD
jgi:hypothetical protein